MMDPGMTPANRGANVAAISAAARENEVRGNGQELVGETEVTVTDQAKKGCADEEDVCGVCLELPAPGCFVELWCCGNVLCVSDAQQIGRCPFCRGEPLVWNIIK